MTAPIQNQVSIWTVSASDFSNINSQVQSEVLHKDQSCFPKVTSKTDDSLSTALELLQKSRTLDEQSSKTLPAYPSQGVAKNKSRGSCSNLISGEANWDAFSKWRKPPSYSLSIVNNPKASQEECAKKINDSVTEYTFGKKRIYSSLPEKAATSYTISIGNLPTNLPLESLLEGIFAQAQSTFRQDCKITESSFCKESTPLTPSIWHVVVNTKEERDQLLQLNMRSIFSTEKIYFGSSDALSREMDNPTSAISNESHLVVIRET